MKQFTDSHEWIEMTDEGLARIGISDYGQQQLGEIVYVELPTVGKEISAGQEIAVLESTKAAADIYSPISGVVVAINDALVEKPELINQSAEADGWICLLSP